jgi:hypothetical protein
MATRPSRPGIDRTLLGPAEDPDHLVGVPAGEPIDRAWLTAELADWLNTASQATTQDFHHYFFDRLRNPDKTAVFLEQISERIAALLDGDRGQP